MKLSDREARLVAHDHGHWDLDLTLDRNSVAVMVKQDTLVVPHPQLWWPVHMGAQPLYTCTWTHSKTGQCVGATWASHAGMAGRARRWARHLACTSTADPCMPRGNVVPPIYEAHSDKGWRNIVANAKGANMNMVRVWGGGVYPPDAFFIACDRGILVWQDFMFACAMVPDDERFTKNVMAEAKQHVQRLSTTPRSRCGVATTRSARAWMSNGAGRTCTTCMALTVAPRRSAIDTCSMTSCQNSWRVKARPATCPRRPRSMPARATNMRGVCGLGWKTSATTATTAVDSPVNTDFKSSRHARCAKQHSRFNDDALQFRHVTKWIGSNPASTDGT